MSGAIDRQPCHPALELIGRYRVAFKAAWAARHELAGPKRMADETAFGEEANERVYSIHMCRDELL